MRFERPLDPHAVLCQEKTCLYIYTSSPIQHPPPYPLHQIRRPSRRPLTALPNPLFPRQPRLIPVRRHALHLPRRLGLPLDPLIAAAPFPHPIRHVALRILNLASGLVAVLDIDNRHDGDAAVPQAPEVGAPRLGFAVRALVRAGGAEPDLGFEEGLGREGGGAVPAGEDLEGFPGPEVFEGEGVVPEDLPGEVPVAVGGDVEEGVAVHAAGDPDVVECRVGSGRRPVHGADHVGVLIATLVDEFENVLGADCYVVEENDGGVIRGIALVKVVQQWLQCLIAQSRQSFDAVTILDTIFGQRVDVARIKVVSCTHAFDLLS